MRGINVIIIIIIIVIIIAEKYIYAMMAPPLRSDMARSEFTDKK